MSRHQVNWELIPQGNTQKGVNLAILRYLFDHSTRHPVRSLLDAPCGHGDFLRGFHLVFPEAHMEGFDLYCNPHSDVSRFFQKGDLKTVFQKTKTEKFDVIANISGVMVDDHVSEFIRESHQHLNEKGVLVLTNDNVITLRDRLSFFFFGRLKRFKLFYAPHEGNWNVVLIQGLWKLLKTHGYEIRRVQYTSIYPEDYALIPLALLLYPFHWLSVCFGKGEMDATSRRKLFPFKALLARHYVIFAEKI